MSKAKKTYFLLFSSLHPQNILGFTLKGPWTMQQVLPAMPKGSFVKFDEEWLTVTANGVDQSHADYKNSLYVYANFLPWWLVWELERRCRWTRLRMARPQPRLWLQPPLLHPFHKSPRVLCVSVKGLVTERIFIQGGRKKWNIKGMNHRRKIGENQLTPRVSWGGHYSHSFIPSSNSSL